MYGEYFTVYFEKAIFCLIIIGFINVFLFISGCLRHESSLKNVMYESRRLDEWLNHPLMDRKTFVNCFIKYLTLITSNL